MINSVSTNQASLVGQRNLNDIQESQRRTLNQLSSGKRINSAADDAAASAIVEQFAAQIVGSGQAVRNLSDGISVAQTADGVLSSVEDNTQRIRELTVQAGNSTLSVQDRAAIQDEVSALSQTNADSLRNANYNGQPLFQGGSQTFQAGPNANDQISISIGALAGGSVGSATGVIDLSTPASATAALDQLDKDLNTLGSSRSSLGALNSRFEASINNLQTRSENLSAARSRIEDTDYAQAASQRAQEQIRNDAALAVQTQANASPRQVLSLLRS
ncbi:flagellin [Chitinimonas naiadis]